MQLDDVVHSSVTGPRLEEATHRFMVIIDNHSVSHPSYSSFLWPLSRLTWLIWWAVQ